MTAELAHLKQLDDEVKQVKQNQQWRSDILSQLWPHTSSSPSTELSSDTPLRCPLHAPGLLKALFDILSQGGMYDIDSKSCHERLQLALADMQSPTKDLIVSEGLRQQNKILEQRCGEYARDHAQLIHKYAALFRQQQVLLFMLVMKYMRQDKKLGETVEKLYKSVLGNTSSAQASASPVNPSIVHPLAQASPNRGPFLPMPMNNVMTFERMPNLTGFHRITRLGNSVVLN